MLSYLLLFSIINYIIAYNPSCVYCKWLPVNNKVNNKVDDLDLCKVGICNIHCRKVDLKSDLKSDSLLDMEIYDEIDALNNRCCGEVNETDDIEQLENDFVDIFQKIKKYNTHNFYNT